MTSTITTPAPARRQIGQRQAATWPAYAAAGWSFLFAGLSFYWAVCISLGRGGGADLVAREFVTLAAARDPGFIALMWLTAVAKLFGGVFALTLVRSWGAVLPSRVRRILTWAGGIGLTLYGGANFVEHGLMQAGVVSLPAGLGEKALHWHLLVWDPYWLLGGVLFLAAARAFRQTGSLIHS